MTPLARRTMSRRWMPERCRIERPPANAKGAYNAATGAVVVPASAVVYEGPCGIGSRAGSRGTAEAGAAEQESGSVIRVPGDAFDVGGNVRKGDLVRIVSSSHPSVNGAVFEVDRALHDSATLSLILQVKRSEPSTPSRGAVG